VEVCSTLSSTLTSGSVSRLPSLRSASCRHNVCVRGPGSIGSVMAEEAKKLAACAAVDNHVEVG